MSRRPTRSQYVIGILVVLAILVALQLVQTGGDNGALRAMPSDLDLALLSDNDLLALRETYSLTPAQAVMVAEEYERRQAALTTPAASQSGGD